MALSQIVLDDRNFQELVNEARLRITRTCPEWTEYNVSDPGITLIELFAWMTELMVYRLNKVPDRNYVKFLEMIGVELMPAAAADAELTFRLSTAFPLDLANTTQATVPSGIEVASSSLGDAPEVIFTTVEPLVIAGPILTQLRGEDFHKNYMQRLDV